MPAVTVYVTNYNYGKFLDQAINSILDQTYRNFEILIIDDGSNDNSKQIIKKYEDIENVFTVYQSNNGLNKSNNIALKMARGKYLIRLDADDYLDPHALELMVSKLDEHKDIALVFPDYYEVDIDGNILKQIQRHNFDKDVTLFDQPAHGACTMIRKNVLMQVGGYDESEKKQDGYDIWIKIIDKYKISNINLPLFFYRQHQNNLTRDEKDLLEVRSRIKEKHVSKKGKKLSVLAIVPIRGNNYDPRSFPLKKFNNKCLLDYTLDEAISNNYLTDILVTTPEKDVINYVNKKYKKIFLLKRDPKLAKINTPLNETILDAVNFYASKKNKTDAIMILNIENPFRSEIYIKKAIHTMQLYDVDTVVGVSDDDGLFLKHTGSGMELVNPSSSLRLERDKLYRKVGGLTLIKTNAFRKSNQLITGEVGHIFLDNRAALCLDSDFNVEIFNSLLAN
tara:strand:+ start:4368 stop:5720 length:1353 start_codon:yes stop_codon:yes gene_type:complete